MFEIKKQLLPIGHINRSGVKITPTVAVVHYTANDSPKATDTMNVRYASREYELGLYKDSKGNIVKGYIEKGSKDAKGIGKKFRYGSAQWYIDMDSATLAIPQTEEAMGCGDRALPADNGYRGQTKFTFEVLGGKPNKHALNYELCNNADWDKTCANGAKIIARDMVDYNIPMTMLVRHYDISGKICPKPLIDETKWAAFKKLVENEIKAIMIKEIKIMFSDEKDIATWAKPSVDRMVQLGVFSSGEAVGFRPNDPITRQELAVVLDRFAKILGK